MDCEHGKLDAIAHVAFVENRRQHVLHVLHGEPEIARDLTIGFSGDDGRDDFALTGCQVERVWHRLSAACAPSLSNRGAVKDRSREGKRLRKIEDFWVTGAAIYPRGMIGYPIG
jgi:hypothetical protein